MLQLRNLIILYTGAPHFHFHDPGLQPLDHGFGLVGNWANIFLLQGFPSPGKDSRSPDALSSKGGLEPLCR